MASHQRDRDTLETCRFATPQLQSNHENYMIRRLSSNFSAPKWQTIRAFSMAWYCSGSTNAELVENLFKVELIKNERVKEAMLGVSSCTPSPSVLHIHLTPGQG